MGFDVYASRLANAVLWAHNFSPFQYPSVAACCDIVVMATADAKHDLRISAPRCHVSYCANRTS